MSPNDSVLRLLRLESLVLFVLCIFVYDFLQGSFFIFVVTLFLFDISMLGYLVDKRIGAVAYNVGHSLAMPALAAILAVQNDTRWLLLFAITWFAHICLDRGLGYGLKLQDFHHTHLGVIGKKKK